MKPKSLKLPFEMTPEMCVYLEKLRASGETNMHGAVPYLEREFGISTKAATTFLFFWMHNYQDLIKEGYFERLV